jgi:DNA-binding MarR family transcriptional regulator
MSSGKGKSREVLTSELVQAARRSATMAVLFHGAIAAQFGLSATDTRTMELLDRLGPQSAGEIATYTGLAPTSVTALIDRLEVRRLVRRTHDPNDRRRVVVVREPEGAAGMNGHYAAIARTTLTLLARYSENELRAITEFLNESATYAESAVAKLGTRSARTLPAKEERGRKQRPRASSRRRRGE